MQSQAKSETSGQKFPPLEPSMRESTGSFLGTIQTPRQNLTVLTW